MNDRLLVLDLDGTVMGGDLKIAGDVVTAISRAREAGIIVTIATGRVYHSALHFLPALGIDQPIICYQGAIIREPGWGATIASACLGSGQAVRAVTRLRNDDLFTILFHDNKTFVERRGEGLDLYLSFHPGGEADVRVVDDLADFAGRVEPVKLLFATDPARLDGVVASLSDDFQNDLSVIRSHRFFGEVTATGVHKGWAIEQLAAHLGISRKNVIAIGDEENDTPMIEWAGLGFAMGNAPESVQARADVVLPSLAENGVAYAIEHYILPERMR